MQARRVGVASQVVQIDREHAYGLGAVDEAEDPASPGHLGEPLDRIQVASPGHVAECDCPRALGEGALEEVDHMVFALQRAGHPDLADEYAVASGPQQPGSPAGGMLLRGDDDLVAGREVESDGLEVQRFGRVAREHDFARTRSEQAVETGDHLLGDPA